MRITMRSLTGSQKQIITTYSGVLSPASDGTISVDVRDVGAMQVAGFIVQGPNNASATAAPGSTDDSTGGYGPGSIWINQSTDTAYICKSSTAGAAVWDVIGGTGGSPTFAGLTLSGLTQGSALFAGASGVLSQDNSNFFWDATNHRLGIGTVLPQAKLSIGAAASTARSYNLFTDASNGEWAYMGDWGLSANVASYGANKNGAGTYRPTEIVAGGLVTARAQINGDFRLGTGSALATDATGGFPFIPTCAGTPTGVPANAVAGSAAIIYDTTAHKFWAYDQPAGAWKNVALT